LEVIVVGGNMKGMKKYDVYTDGGASPNPGLGGWGVVIVKNQKSKIKNQSDGASGGVKKGDEVVSEVVEELSGGEVETSNNRMEMMAGVAALEWAIKNKVGIRLHTDSGYLKQGITSWINNWKRNGWRTASKKPVLNQDLWMRLDELNSQAEVEWVWVRGHVGNKWNERADALVWEARERVES